MTHIADQCIGKWRGLLPMFGVDVRLLSGRHTKCPLCDGNDRFRFDDKGGRGTSFCNQCGSMSGIEMVKRLKGWDFARTAKELEAVVGTVQYIPPKANRSNTERLRKAMDQLWQARSPLIGNDPAARYLCSRGLSSKSGRWPESLGFYPNCPYERDAGTFRDAMLARIDDPDGKMVQLQRTYFGDGWKKRKNMPGPFPEGSAWRMCEARETLGIAEGVETAIAAAKLFRVPVWAALDARNLQLFRPPQQVRNLIIFGDCDKSFTGQAAAYSLAHLLRCGPKRIEGLNVEVRIPDTLGNDWNDELLQGKEPYG